MSEDPTSDSQFGTFDNKKLNLALVLKVSKH